MFVFAPYLIIALIMLIILWPRVLNPWYRAIRAGAPVPLSRIAHIWFQRLDPNAVVDAYIMAVTAQMDVSFTDIESHAATGGNVQRTVLAAVAAHKAGLDYDHHMAIAADMAGREVVAEVNDLIAAQRTNQTELRPGPDTGAMIGASGTASSPVGAPGIVKIDGRDVSAVAKDGPIPKGSAIRVVQSSGGIAVVERIPHTKKG
jgi:hypothetical protein